MGQAQINVRTRACSTTSIARTKQAALTHNVRGKELNNHCCVRLVWNDFREVGLLKEALYRIWCDANRLGDGGLGVVYIHSAIIQLLLTRRVSYCYPAG